MKGCNWELKHWCLALIWWPNFVKDEVVIIIAAIEFEELETLDLMTSKSKKTYF